MVKISDKLRRQQPPQENSEVKELQRELKALGLYSGDLDGKFGPLTENAVKDAQTDLRPLDSPPFEEAGCVDDRLAELINREFDKSPLGILIGNRRKKFDNKTEAIEELDNAMKKEEPGQNPNRRRLDDLYDRKYRWLQKKRDEAGGAGVWSGISGYAFVVPAGQEFLASITESADLLFAIVRKSGVGAVILEPPGDDGKRREDGNGHRDEENDGAKEDDEDETPAMPISDLLYMGEPARQNLLKEIDEELTKTITKAIENLEKWLEENPNASIEDRDAIRERIDIWRSRLDRELVDTGEPSVTPCLSG